MKRLDALFLLAMLLRGAPPADAAILHPPLPQAESKEEMSAAEIGESDDSWRGPVANRNQFPPAFLFISLGPERARVLGKGERTVSVNFDYSNILILQKSDLESLEIDLESLHAVFQANFGLGRNLEIAGRLPLYWMQAGFLDPFISDFHHAFGLPNYVRDVEPDNIFRYHWRVEDVPILEREEGFVALGDLTVQVKRAFSWRELGATELAARAAIKLPTGSRDKLAGSGGTDLGFGVELSRVGRKVGGFFNLSYHVTSDLDEARSKNFFSWMAAVDWRFKPSVSAILQYDESRPMLESDISALSKDGRQVILGLRWRRSDRFHYEWRFAEDLSSTSPDFTLGFQITYNWTRTE
ncbi:MAG: DUF3187 family protein [Vicinamibacteria bacterium]